MKHTKTLSLAGLSIAVGMVAAVLAAPLWHQHGDPVGIMHPMWAYNYDSLSEMSQDVDAVIVATVDGSRTGRTVATGADSNILPFTLVDLKVEEVLAGAAPKTVTVEQTGGGVGDRYFQFADDGGTYVPGTRVVLFLNAQPDTDYYYLAHPMGRFLVKGKRLHAVLDDDPVAQALDRRTLDQARRLIHASVNR